MSWIIVVPILTQAVIPLAWIARLALVRPAGVRDVAAEGAAVALYLWILSAAGLWLVLPPWTPGVLAVLLAGALVRALVRALGHAGGGAGSVASRRFAAMAWRLGLVAAMGWGAARVHVDRRGAVGDTVPLAFPLGPGAYRVVAGGGNAWVNPHHFKTLDAPRFQAYRGQSYAVDLVGEGAWGSRRWAPFGAALTRFAVYGAEVVAPCPGTVVRSRGEAPETGVVGSGPEALLGNHVILDCGGVWVVLAHLRPGSVRVAAGDVVVTGRLLGAVGNSGRSDEPHLHIHAQTPGSPGALLDGEPLPMEFQGRRLARNDRVAPVGSSTPLPRSSDPASAGSQPFDTTHLEIDR